jgi:hypothetical protein
MHDCLGAGPLGGRERRITPTPPMELLGKSHVKGVGGWDKKGNRYAGKTGCPPVERSLRERGGGQESGSAPPPLPPPDVTLLSNPLRHSDQRRSK